MTAEVRLVAAVTDITQGLGQAAYLQGSPCGSPATGAVTSQDMTGALCSLRVALPR